MQRGSITFWMSDDFEKTWLYAGEKQRGSQFEYTDQAILMMLTVKEVFRLSCPFLGGDNHTCTAPHCVWCSAGVVRLKTIFGNELSARLLETQTTQALVRCAALNKMTRLVMPQSYKVA